MQEDRRLSRWIVEPDAALAGYTVEWAAPEGLVLSRRQRLFRADVDGRTLRFVGCVDAPLWQRISSRARPLQRLLRFMFYNVIDMPDGSLFVTFGKSVGIVRDRRYEPIEGLRRPSRFLRGACAVAEDGSVYLGEYLSNKERGPMAVYRWRPGSSRLEVVHEFAPGAIRHVHGVYYDPFEKLLWCVTGDNGREARIMRTRDFSDIETIGAGDETWRCVSLLFTAAAVYYGMDAEFVPNGLYRIDRRTLERTRFADVTGPVYYSRAQGSELFFGVTAELCPSQTDDAATLWHVAADGSCAPLASFRKDALPVGAFMPGTIDLAQGPGLPDRIWFRLTAVSGDGTVFCARRVSSSD